MATTNLPTFTTQKATPVAELIFDDERLEVFQPLAKRGSLLAKHGAAVAKVKQAGEGGVEEHLGELIDASIDLICACVPKLTREKVEGLELDAFNELSDWILTTVGENIAARKEELAADPTTAPSSS